MTGPARRRGRTRWLLTTPLVGLAVIVGGVIWLESLAPQTDTAPMRVEGVPPLARQDTPACTRQGDGLLVTDTQSQFPRHGRVGSTQVYACPSAYDGLEVTYVGEVVGELLPRDGGAWAQVNDDAYALEVGPVLGHREHAGFNGGMTVWLPHPLPERIEAPGRATQRGDVILVRGELLRADPDDGGGITIRAHELETLADPTPVEAPFHGAQAVAAGLLAAVAAVALLLSRRHRNR